MDATRRCTGRSHSLQESGHEQGPAGSDETATIRYGDIARTGSANDTLNPVTVVSVGTQV